MTIGFKGPTDDVMCCDGNVTYSGFWVKTLCDSSPLLSSSSPFLLLLVFFFPPLVDAQLTSRSEMYGSLQSPNFPEPYPRETQLRWNISVPDGFHIKLYFSHFDLEPSFLCEYDYVKVRPQGIVGSLSFMFETFSASTSIKYEPTLQTANEQKLHFKVLDQLQEENKQNFLIYIWNIRAE